MGTSIFAGLVCQHIQEYDRTLFSFRKYTGRNTNGQTIGRHVSEDDRVGSNAYIVSNMNRPQYLCAGTYVNAISYNRRAAVACVLQSHSYSIPNDAIVSKNSVAADDDSAKMLDPEPAAKRHFTWKLDASKYLGNHLQNLIEERKWHSQPPPANGEAPASEAVHSHHPKTLTRYRPVVSAPILA
jgi:hypothetical protein